MLRPFSVLLLLGLAGPRHVTGHGQAGDTLAPPPPSVSDTARRVEGARPGAGAALHHTDIVGIAAGVSVWPPDLFCTGPMTGTAQPLDPRGVLQRIQLAAKCGVRLVLVTPRKFLTTSGRVKGAFLVDRAKALTDQYAAELPPDTLRKYRETLLGMNLADDYDCRKCWGGQQISQSDIEDWAAYTRTKLPGLPLGVRVEADWVAADPKLAPLLDYTWAQYQSRKGDQQSYYDKAAREARSLGLKIVMGVSVQNCYGVGSGPCSPADLLKFGTAAVSNPASCAFLNWKYDPETWDDPQVQATWAKLLALAKSRPTTDCRRAGD
jgi:hypothetical protein